MNHYENLEKNQVMSFGELKELFKDSELHVRIEVYKGWELKYVTNHYLVFKKDSFKAFLAKEMTRVFSHEVDEIIYKNIPAYISGKLCNHYFEVYLKEEA